MYVHVTVEISMQRPTYTMKSIPLTIAIVVTSTVCERGRLVQKLHVVTWRIY